MSCTPNDLYSFNLPFAVYSWNKLGVPCVLYIPWYDMGDVTDGECLRLGFAAGLAGGAGKLTVKKYTAAKDKIITYAQCIRLYAAAEPTDTGILITTDADMAVFNEDYWKQFDMNGWINVIGSDLVPSGQVPMCYIAAPVVGWRHMMQIKGRTAQQCVDDLLGNIEAENFRGNYWAKDQETAYQAINREGIEFYIQYHHRSDGTNQFATRRADRDGWHVSPDIIDAHLPRPGYTDDNFAKILALFSTMYPNDDLTWMTAYRNEYLKLMSHGG